VHINHKIYLDATQDDCPLPTIRTKDILDSMGPDEILKLVTRREGTIKNIRTFVRKYPCALISVQKAEEGFVFYIQKTSASSDCKSSTLGVSDA
jgi:tRNA 2-thiouridine synthesizing protein A